ncbi:MULTISPECIES: hypothetical protein [unclassified Microbacterium]|uniref:hypothetical protein n=1 Tax=unclassified Microbacterium TaxID=2609290 RepID=UPI002882EAA3|nr:MULTISPECIES: hypothetical protein [unclassified Microbacterium]
MMKTLQRRKLEARAHRDSELKRQAEEARKAAEAAALKKSARRSLIRSILGWSTAVAVVAGMVVLTNWANDLGERNRQAYREEIANTEFSLVTDSTDSLLRRVDGSYYSVSTDDIGVVSYAYSTVDERGGVVERSVSSREITGERFLWIKEMQPVDVTVKVIDPEAVSQEPRVVGEICTAEPIDSSKPSYTDDPRSAFGPDGHPADDLYGPRLCVNRVTLWVPDGAIQP